MRRSDWLSRMYAMPSNVTSQPQPMCTQTLHSKPGSQTTGTSALSGRCSNAFALTSPSCLDPYIKRTCYLLKNLDGQWLGDIQQETLIWVSCPDDAQVYCHLRTAKQTALMLRDMGLITRDELFIAKVMFYAHKARAHLWSAAYV